jgi:hypothetical protein
MCNATACFATPENEHAFSRATHPSPLHRTSDLNSRMRRRPGRDARGAVVKPLAIDQRRRIICDRLPPRVGDLRPRNIHRLPPARVSPAAVRGSPPLRTGRALLSRLLPPVRPRVGSDDTAARANHARAGYRHRNIVGPPVGARRRFVRHYHITARATARRSRACCGASSRRRGRIGVASPCPLETQPQGL